VRPVAGGEAESDLAKLLRHAEAAYGGVAPQEVPADFNADEVRAMFKAGEFFARPSCLPS
jgi:hypothetical protein